MHRYVRVGGVIGIATALRMLDTKHMGRLARRSNDVSLSSLDADPLDHFSLTHHDSHA